MNSPLLFTISHSVSYPCVLCQADEGPRRIPLSRETRERFPQCRPPRWTSRCKPLIIIMHVCAHTYTHNHTDPCTITRCLRRRPRSRAKRIQTRGFRFRASDVVCRTFIAEPTSHRCLTSFPTSVSRHKRTTCKANARIGGCDPRPGKTNNRGRASQDEKPRVAVPFSARGERDSA